MEVETEIEVLKTRMKNVEHLLKLVLGITGVQLLAIMITTIAILNEVLT